jgi:glutathione synthase/RimK-type ligase-like ATP-grasp enzyme
MIVFYGRIDDPPIFQAIESAQELDLTYIVLDLAHLDREKMVLQIDDDGVQGYIVAAGQIVPLEDIRGIYARPLDLPQRSDRDLIARSRAQSFQSMFLDWLEFATPLVISRPHLMETNFSKPLQTQIIAQSGLQVPDTIVTNDPQAVREFWHKHQRVIFKSTSGIRSIVQELDEKSAARLDHVRSLPTQFQAYITGTDVRVHVVGQQIFATEISSNAIDYRYARQTGRETNLQAITLPEKIEMQCLKLATLLDLPFCGIDLRRCPNGEYVCFEVNPMPAYTYYQAYTGQPISLALIKLLNSGLTSELRYRSQSSTD